MNIIFLDIDGVLNSSPYFKTVQKCEGFCELSDYHLQKLATIYHEFNAKIVLSSTWRTLDDIKDNSKCFEMWTYLINSLAKYGMEIIDKTPLISNNRPLEIKTWIDNQSKNINFVILDDDFSKEEYQKYGLENHLIQTLFFCKDINLGGLQDKHIEKAREILKRDV